MNENVALAERAYIASFEEISQRKINRQESSRLKITGRQIARHNSPEDAALIARIGRLQASAISLVQEIKSLNITNPKVDVTKGVDFYNEVRRFEVNLIRQALVLTDGHQMQAARLLGLGMTTLNSMIKRFGICPHDPMRETTESLNE